MPLGRKTYAAPASALPPTAWMGAPTTAVPLLTATDAPSWSLAAASLAVYSCWNVQEVPLCVNT